MDWEKLKAQINGSLEWLLLGLAVLCSLLSFIGSISYNMSTVSMGLWIAYSIVHVGERLRPSAAKASENTPPNP